MSIALVLRCLTVLVIMLRVVVLFFFVLELVAVGGQAQSGFVVAFWCS